MIRIPGTILCAGNLTEDILVWPVEEIRFGATMWVEDIITSIGGNGANTAFAIARLGGTVRVTGTVGRDAEGDYLVEVLSQAGAEVRVERCDLPTPSTVVIVRRDAARAFLHRPGASRAAFGQGLSFTPEMIAGCSHFHLANPFSMPEMRKRAGDTVAHARAAGLTTSLDTGWDALGGWMEVIGPCLEHLDLLFLNDDEAEKLSGYRDPGKAAAFFRDRGVESVVVKLGPDGCAVFDADGTESRVPGFTVTAVDSTGAGDCFAGGYLASLQRSMTALDSARVANAAGALSVQRPGATNGLLDYEATLRWMNGSSPVTRR